MVKIKDNLKKISAVLGLIILGGAGALGVATTNPSPELEMGASYPDAKWAVVSQFDGYQTNVDPTAVSDGANPQGQNTTANERDRISVRKLGYEVFPTGDASADTDKITSSYTFRKRSGENIMMRSYGTVQEYYEEDNDTWENLRSGLTSGAEFDYGMYNINTDLTSYIYFGNASDSGARWTGAHTMTNGAVTTDSTEIIVDDISGFLITGNLRLCGTDIAYSGINLTTNTITLIATSTIACADNRGVSQTVDELSAHPVGNIYIVANNRLFIAGIASTSQAVYFSEYGDATNFVGADLVTDSTATSPGIFNLGTGGGGVTGMAFDESSIYIFKRSAVWKATLTDTLYTLTILKPVDSKSQTTGAVNNRSIFTGHNAVYFITPDNQLMSLQRVEQIDYPQIVPISDKIKPTVDAMNFDDSSGIVFRDRAYFSVKQNTDVSNNDTILIFNTGTKQWDSPIVGWNVQDFTIYDDGTSEELYIGSSNSTNNYKVNTTPTDDIFEVASNWRSKQYSFDMPHQQKQIVDLFIEGYISPSTELTVSLLLDEDGYTQSLTTIIDGADDDLIYDSSDYNVFGLSAFGTKRFGSNEDESGMKKFRVYLGKDFRASPFYVAQIEFASEGDNQNWEILDYAIRWRPYSQGEKRELYQAFKE